MAAGHLLAVIKNQAEAKKMRARWMGFTHSARVVGLDDRTRAGGVAGRGVVGVPCK